LTNGSPASLLVPLGIAVLVAWRSYRRIRRTIGRQRLSNVRPWITITVLPILCALFLLRALPQPLAIAALAGGVIAGVGLGIYGLRVTRFEQTSAGLFYTPSAHLGIGLSLLLVGRIGYKFVQLYALSTGTLSTGVPPTMAGPLSGYVQSPLTLLIFAALAGYYVTYAIGLLRWRGRTLKSQFTLAANDPTG